MKKKCLDFNGAFLWTLEELVVVDFNVVFLWTLAEVILWTLKKFMIKEMIFHFLLLINYV